VSTIKKKYTELKYKKNISRTYFNYKDVESMLLLILSDICFEMLRRDDMLFVILSVIQIA
jgi:hypothetical protein